MKIDNKMAMQFKKDFLIFKNNKGLIYLDNAATSQRPKSVIDSMDNFYNKENANVGRGIYTLAQRAMIKYNEARKTVAEFINADEKEIIFTRNTTESLNLLSYTLSSIIKEGRDEIVLTEMEHHSNLIPWQQLAKRNKMKLRFIRLKDNYTLDYKDAEKKITDKTAILSFTHASNTLGTINDIKKLVSLGKKKGAITIMDAAQSIQNIKINTKNIGCDFLVFSSHKMLGPTGIGVLYGRKELLEKLPPFNFGGGMIEKVTYQDASWAKIPEKFEAGTQNIGEAVGLTEAIRYIQEIGIENIGKWERELLEYGLKSMGKIKNIKIYNPGKDKSVGIISFNLKGVHPHDVAELLNEKGIAIRAGHNCTMPLMNRLGINASGVCRASFYIYNTFEDIDSLISTLKKIKEKFE